MKSTHYSRIYLYYLYNVYSQMHIMKRPVETDSFLGIINQKEKKTKMSTAKLKHEKLSKTLG